MTAALDGRNDLEASATALCPEIGPLLETLAAQSGVRLARMSGSGATCFALFDGEAACRDAATTIAALFPTYWCLETALR